MLLRYIDINGNLQMVRLSPSDAAADGTSATLVVPDYANGAFTLQVLGSASQPLLQIVPTLTSLRRPGPHLYLYGSGFVEGASSYSFRGRECRHGGRRRTTSTSTTTRRSVSPERQRLPNRDGAAHARAGQRDGHHGRRHQRAAGAQRACAANVGGGASLGDVAVDAAGNLWVSDDGQPGPPAADRRGHRPGAADHHADAATSARPTRTTTRGCRCCGRR